MADDGLPQLLQVTSASLHCTVTHRETIISDAECSYTGTQWLIYVPFYSGTRKLVDKISFLCYEKISWTWSNIQKDINFPKMIKSMERAHHIFENSASLFYDFLR